MTDLPQLREEIIAGFTNPPLDILDQVSRGHLVMAYNDIAPAHLAIGTARTSLEVQAPSRTRLTSKELSALTEHCSRAVASIGREIAEPARGGQLTSADYTRAPIYASHTATGTVLFLASPEAPGMGGMDNGLTTAEQSLERLVSLMPESAEDEHFAERVRSLRATSARAVSEVAAAAKANSGLTMNLRGAHEVVDSVVTEDQAEYIADLLSDTSKKVTHLTVKGRLDGMRFKRRMFYLESGDDDEYPETIDEALVDEVKDLLGQEVTARLEKITYTSLAGRRSRPTYRLVGVAQQTAIDD